MILLEPIVEQIAGWGFYRLRWIAAAWAFPETKSGTVRESWTCQSAATEIHKKFIRNSLLSFKRCLHWSDSWHSVFIDSRSCHEHLVLHERLVEVTELRDIILTSEIDFDLFSLPMSVALHHARSMLANLPSDSGTPWLVLIMLLEDRERVVKCRGTCVLYRWALHVLRGCFPYDSSLHHIVSILVVKSYNFKLLQSWTQFNISKIRYLQL